ncbi:unnamed protein product [Prorocentrum cordatum]|uniref:Kinesin motor domain-containing protein n=1 Tax=Prorocentrum cordatum TaxID=2364126 RepID=A0ABN9V9X5_9DINO|nr:unnamed protein product [Polarella glacialis]
MDGYHGCVFAYGQTGSGKTHTIFGGPAEERGLVPRIAEDLFAGLEPGGGDSAVRLSYLELYNEKARDLLSPAAHGSPPSLEVREHPRVGVFVQGLTKNRVHSAGEVARLLDFGHRVRAVGRTNMNAVSSRSHAIVTFHVERAVLGSGSGGDPFCSRRRRAQLHAVDLAGSERLWQTGDSEVRQHESKQINKSLLALSTMISRLADREKGSKFGGAAKSYVPYRDSKLTFLLSESLMGNCKTAMLACISPSAQCFSMTESTIRFAESVKRIRTRPVRNEEVEGDLLRALQAELGGLRQQLQAAEGAATGAGQDVGRRLAEDLEVARSLTDELSMTPAEEQALTARADARRQRSLASLGGAASEAAAADEPPPPPGDERARRLARSEERLPQRGSGPSGGLRRQSPARAVVPPIW